MIKSLKNFIFEPLGILLIIAIFVVPTLAIINLSAETKFFPTAQTVLGTTDQKEIKSDISLVGGIHNYIKNEKMEIDPQGFHIYHATIGSREGGNYSKPIIELSNNSENIQTYYFSGAMTIDKNSKVGLTFNDANYIIQDSGELYRTSISLNPSESVTMFLSINNPNDILFSDEIEIMFAQQ